MPGMPYLLLSSSHDPEILKFLNQEKEVALNFMVCFGIHLQGL
jgi:hypothetical protein